MILYQPQKGYCYNSDTHFLYDFICANLQIFKNIQGELLDIGSGSGILGLLIAREYKKLNLNSCEIQDNFAFLTTKNAKINNINLNLYHTSFVENSFEKEFDIVVSNPPFYPSSVVQTSNENIKIARYNDNLPLDIFISKTSKILKPLGKFFFCYDVKLLNDIIILLKQNNLNIESLQFLHPKKDKKSTLVMVYARKNSKSLMDILPPLIMFDGDNLSSKVEQIYKKCDTHSIKVEL
ncbi:MAG: methyltransferase [Arcobacteraceae bacterium]|nr:methyltransferase [Arcobacteraceae bacterium]